MLASQAAAVTDIDGKVVRIVEEMFDTLYDSDSGIGLAAPQVGIQRQIFVWDMDDEPMVILNPTIVESDGEWVYDEGCLSIPGLYVEMTRPKTVLMKGIDMNGNEISLEADELEARLFQHELDHLNGVLMVDRMQPEQRKLAIGLFEQGKQEQFPYAQVLEQFRRECLRRRNLIQMFLEILTATALADGAMDPAERRVLDGIAVSLGVSQAEYDRLVMRMNAQFRFSTDARPQDKLQDAYKVLGLESGAETPEVKKAYRKLMSQHHPDKLVSKGLPEEMMEIAKRKTHEIKTAYDTIMAQRGE